MRQGGLLALTATFDARPLSMNHRVKPGGDDCEGKSALCPSPSAYDLK
jgi:hypothetical protein